MSNNTNDKSMDLIGELSKSLGSSDFEISKSSPNDPNKPHPRFSQYKNRGQLSSRQSDQGNFPLNPPFIHTCTIPVLKCAQYSFH